MELSTAWHIHWNSSCWGGTSFTPGVTAWKQCRACAGPSPTAAMSAPVSSGPVPTMRLSATQTLNSTLRNYRLHRNRCREIAQWLGDGYAYRDKEEMGILTVCWTQVFEGGKRYFLSLPLPCICLLCTTELPLYGLIHFMVPSGESTLCTRHSSRYWEFICEQNQDSCPWRTFSLRNRKANSSILGITRVG